MILFYHSLRDRIILVCCFVTCIKHIAARIFPCRSEHINCNTLVRISTTGIGYINGCIIYCIHHNRMRSLVVYVLFACKFSMVNTNHNPMPQGQFFQYSLQIVMLGVIIIHSKTSQQFPVVMHVNTNLFIIPSHLLCDTA